MSDNKMKNAEYYEIGNMTEAFVDDLVMIEEFGTVAHVTFARYVRSGGSVYREGVVRLIIPRELRVAMGRRLMVGAVDTTVSTTAEDASLH